LSQLVGILERATMYLNTITDIGVELVGRLSAVRYGVLLISEGLPNVCALPDLKMMLHTGNPGTAGQEKRLVD
jgi:putative flavoprotein involved in K+ transport